MIIARTYSPGMFMYSTVLTYYDYRQYILPRNVYVQFSLIMTTDNT